jgi:hypothetical protein
MKLTLKTRVPPPRLKKSEYFVFGGDYSELVLPIDTLSSTEAKNVLCRIIDLLQITENATEAGDMVTMFEANALIKKVVYIKEKKKAKGSNGKNKRRTKGNG